MVDVVAGRSAGIVLDRQLDVSRGDWIATPRGIHAAQRFSATLAWLDTEPAVIGRKYWCATATAGCRRASPRSTTASTSTLEETDAHELAVNDIGHVTVELQQPLPVERLRDQPRRRRADRRRPGQQPHQRRAAGARRGLSTRAWAASSSSAPGRARPT